MSVLEALVGKDGQVIHIGDRVAVTDGPHQGNGVVDALDLEAKKVWVLFDPMGPTYPMIFWVDAAHAMKV